MNTSETSIPLLGGASTVYQPDALDGVSSSPERYTCRARTKRFAPFGPNGEGYGKRLFLQLSHQHGFTIQLIPTSDGVDFPDAAGFFSSATPGQYGRASLLLPLFKETAVSTEGPITNAIRGTSFGARLVVTNPTAQIHLESLTFEAEPLMRARGRRTTD